MHSRFLTGKLMGISHGDFPLIVERPMKLDDLGGPPVFGNFHMCGGWVQPETQSTGLRRGRMCYQLWFRFVRRLQEKHPFKVKEHIRTWSLPNFPINTYLARFLPIIHLSSHKATKISIAPDPPEATQQAGLLSCRVRSQTRELIARSKSPLNFGHLFSHQRILLHDADWKIHGMQRNICWKMVFQRKTMNQTLEIPRHSGKHVPGT